MTARHYHPTYLPAVRTTPPPRHPATLPPYHPTTPPPHHRTTAATVLTLVGGSKTIGGFLTRLVHIGPPYSAWMEETFYHELTWDGLNGVFLGVLLTAMVLRLLKYLSIFPMLSVPVTSIAFAAKELCMFMIVLCLFVYAFAMLFIQSFGGTVEEFSGLAPTFKVLFEAALDGDMPDEVYDAFDLSGGGWHVSYGIVMIIAYR